MASSSLEAVRTCLALGNLRRFGSGGLEQVTAGRLFPPEFSLLRLRRRRRSRKPPQRPPKRAFVLPLFFSEGFCVVDRPWLPLFTNTDGSSEATLVCREVQSALIWVALLAGSQAGGQHHTSPVVEKLPARAGVDLWGWEQGRFTNSPLQGPTLHQRCGQTRAGCTENGELEFVALAV